MSTPASAVRAESTYPTIVKVQRQLRLCPNLADYEHTCHHFTWDSARLMLDGLPGGRGLNIAHEAVDRHAAGPLADHLALRWIGRNGTIWDFTYADPARCDQPLRQRAEAARSRQGRPGVRAHGPHPGAVRRRAGDAQEPQRVLARCSRPSGPEPIHARLRDRRGPGAGDDRGALPAQGGAASASGCRSSSTSSWSARPSSRATSRARSTANALMAEAERGLRDPADRPGGHGAAALHERHHRARRRARSTSTRRSSPTTSPAGSRSTCTRRTSSGARRTRAG